MPAPSSPPEWAQVFLEQLALTGNATAAAEAAGVDVSSAYNRRQRYAGFRDAWVRVLAEREARAGGAGVPGGVARPLARVAGRAVSPGEPGGAAGGPTMARDLSSGAKLIRTGETRWNAGAEERFLVELSASASIRRAAAAAGFSQAAIYRRRLKHRLFAEAWDAAIDTGKTRVEALLIEAATQTFDPESLPMSEGLPKVSVAEAINIVKRAGGAGGGKRGKRELSWEEESEIGQEEYEEAKARIIGRIERIRENDDHDKQAASWQRDEEHDCWIPPNWVRRAE